MSLGQILERVSEVEAINQLVVMRVLHHFASFMLRKRRAHRRSACPVDRAASSDRANPGTNGRDLGVVATGATPGIEKDFLRQLVGSVHVARAASSKGSHHGEVPLVQLGVCVHVSRSGARYKRLVGIGGTDDRHQETFLCVDN